MGSGTDVARESADVVLLGNDLVKFAEALRSYRLVNREITEQLTAGTTDTGTGSKYGFGFGETMVDGQRLIGHNGGAPGMNAVLDLYWNAGYVVVVLSNFDPRSAEDVAAFMRQRILL
jgi:hypothetical protein